MMKTYGSESTSPHTRQQLAQHLCLSLPACFTPWLDAQSSPPFVLTLPLLCLQCLSSPVYLCCVQSSWMCLAGAVAFTVACCCCCVFFLLPCLQGGVLASVLGTGQGGGGKGGSKGAGGKAKGVPKKRDRPAEDKAGHAVGTCLTWLCCVTTSSNHGVPRRPSSFRSGCSWLRAHAAGEGAADVDGLQFSPLLPFPFD